MPAHQLTVVESDDRLSVSLPAELKDRLESAGISSQLSVYPRLSESVLQEINQLGLEAEKLVHGSPSGIDNSISTFGES